MTHVLVLIANGRRNGRLRHNLDVGNMFMSTFGSKIHNNFNSRIETTKKIFNPLDIYFLDGRNLHHLILLQIWYKIS